MRYTTKCPICHRNAQRKTKLLHGVLYIWNHHCHLQLPPLLNEAKPEDQNWWNQSASSYNHPVSSPDFGYSAVSRPVDTVLRITHTEISMNRTTCLILGCIGLPNRTCVCGYHQQHCKLAPCTIIQHTRISTSIVRIQRCRKRYPIVYHNRAQIPGRGTAQLRNIAIHKWKFCHVRNCRRKMNRKQLSTNEYRPPSSGGELVWGSVNR